MSKAIASLTAADASATKVELWSTSRVALRALLAVGVLVLFYAFSVAVIAGLLWVTWLQLTIFGRGGGVVLILVILPPLAALGILLAIWPRFPTWEDPGSGLTEARAPDLFALLRDVARTTGQPMPRRLFLFNDSNAFIANRGIFMGRALGLGLPLFDVMTVDELRAVVAHEYGHYARRGGGLGTLVYRAVRTFASATAAAGAVPGLGLLFGVWTLVFLRVAMPIAQQQELRADELAWRAVGADAMIFALVKLHIAAGEIVDMADPEGEAETRLFSTHPPLRDRVQLARRSNTAPALPSDPRPARVLIEPLLASSGN
jgi:Zn-dependent protease with chaperone function